MDIDNVEFELGSSDDVLFTMHTILMPMSIFCMYWVPAERKIRHANKNRTDIRREGFLSI